MELFLLPSGYEHVKRLKRSSIFVHSFELHKDLPELKSTVITNFIQRLKRSLFEPIKTYQEFETLCDRKKD